MPYLNCQRYSSQLIYRVQHGYNNEIPYFILLAIGKEPSFSYTTALTITRIMLQCSTANSGNKFAKKKCI